MISVFLQQPFLPVSFACASNPFRSGIRLLCCRSNAFPKVRFFVAASLPDKHKVSLSAESDNDKIVTYPQAERFAVDKTENKFAGQLPQTMTAPTLCMEAVRYDGRAGGEEERGPRHQISERLCRRR